MSLDSLNWNSSLPKATFISSNFLSSTSSEYFTRPRNQSNCNRSISTDIPIPIGSVVDCDECLASEMEQKTSQMLNLLRRSIPEEYLKATTAYDDKIEVIGNDFDLCYEESEGLFCIESNNIHVMNDERLSEEINIIKTDVLLEDDPSIYVVRNSIDTEMFEMDF
jgi:hypothetical protein